MKKDGAAAVPFPNLMFAAGLSKVFGILLPRCKSRLGMAVPVGVLVAVLIVNLLCNVMHVSLPQVTLSRHMHDPAATCLTMMMLCCTACLLRSTGEGDS
jgi:hypothetical protein